MIRPIAVNICILLSTMWRIRNSSGLSVLVSQAVRTDSETR
jgi:hypothetical protein